MKRNSGIDGSRFQRADVQANTTEQTAVHRNSAAEQTDALNSCRAESKNTFVMVKIVSQTAVLSCIQELTSSLQVTQIRTTSPNMRSNQVVDAPPGSVSPDLENGWVSVQRDGDLGQVYKRDAEKYASVIPFEDDVPPMMGSWLVGLCGCCTDLVPNCCMTAFCPCISLAQISKRLGTSSYCCGFFLSFLFGCFLTPLFPLWICHLRGATRRRFRIPGNCYGDFCEACCCPCCAIAQMATRAGSYTPGNCNFGSRDSLPPYNPM